MRISRILKSAGFDHWCKLAFIRGLNHAFSPLHSDLSPCQKLDLFAVAAM